MPPKTDKKRKKTNHASCDDEPIKKSKIEEKKEKKDEGTSRLVEPLQPSGMWIREAAKKQLDASCLELYDNLKIPYCSKYWPERWPSILRILAPEAIHAFRMDEKAAQSFESKLLDHMKDPEKQERVSKKIKDYHHHLCGKMLGYMAPERSRVFSTRAFHQVLLVEVENFAKAYL